VAGGLIGALVDAGVPQEQAEFYAEGVRRGGALLTVDADDQQAETARQIMDRHHPVNINQRADYWRQSGWKGYDQKAKPYTAQQISQERNEFQKLNQGGQVRMPVVEEKLAVGKREVQTGGVAVHRRISERPVEENVNLRQERVTVERNPVDRPATPGMMDTFKEGTMEVNAKSEEAVVEKSARGGRSGGEQEGRSEERKSARYRPPQRCRGPEHGRQPHGLARRLQAPVCQQRPAI